MLIRQISVYIAAYAQHNCKPLMNEWRLNKMTQSIVRIYESLHNYKNGALVLCEVYSNYISAAILGGNVDYGIL